MKILLQLLIACVGFSSIGIAGLNSSGVSNKSFVTENPLPKNFRFRCVSSSPTTTYLGEVKGADFVLTVIQHNGKKFMPIHMGIIVPNDFPYLARKAEVLTKLPEQDTFRFPLDRCKGRAPSFVSCSGGETKVIDGVPYEAMHFSTNHIVDESYYFRFERTRVTLDMRVPDFPVQELPMEYYGEECKFENLEQGRVR